MKQVDAAQERLNQEIVYSYTNGIYTEVVRGEVIAPNILPYDQFYLKILVPKSLGNLIWLDIFDFSPEEFKNLTKIVEGDIKSICKNQMEKFLTRPECPVKVISSNNPEIIEEYKNVINYYSQQFAHLKKNHPEDNHEYFQNAISILKKERDDFMGTSFPELSPKIPQEKSSSQEVLYSYKDGVYTEIARGQNVDKELLSDLDGIYLKISLPAIEKIDQELLYDFNFNEQHWLFQIIKGDITEIKADHLEKFCGHPDCQLQAIDSNNPKILDVFNNYLQKFSYLQKDHERECPEYYEELINIIKEEKQVLIKNGFPKLEEIHNVLNNIFEQINNVQKILGSVSDEQESRREVVPELFLNPNEVDDFLCKSRELGAKSLKTEERMKCYQSFKMDTNSSEVRKLIEEVEGIKMEFSTLQESIADSIKKESEKMQVIVIADAKGLYKEIWHELDKDSFLNPVEMKEYLESAFKALNPGEEIKAIEVGKEKYFSINGLDPDVILAKDKLLKAEEKEISTLKKTEGENNLENDIHTKELDQGKETVAKEAASKSMVTNLEDTLQIITVEKKDGTITELKVERNSNLFLRQGELKAYAEDVASINGKFQIIETGKGEYPNVNKYLKNGIMTEEGRKEYQQAKIEFLKKCSPRTTYEITERKEEKAQPEKSPKKGKENKARRQETKERIQTKQQHSAGGEKKEGKRRGVRL